MGGNAGGGGTWGSIAAIFAMVAQWPNVFTIVLAIMLLGGRQLGIAVIMHDAGHSSLFRSWKLDRFAAQWLGVAFIFNDAKAYRIRHARHHRLGGSEEDPDLYKFVNYAMARKDFLRKLRRDITGVTAYRTIKANFKLLGWRGVRTWTIAHTILFGVLLAVGHPWLYLLWIVAYATTNQVILRIRNAAEHGAVEDLLDSDPRKHPRTTLPRIWERPFFAPNYVNYHLEHHVLASVPCYRLKSFHRLLKEKGYLDDAEICGSYWEVVKKLVLPPGVEKENIIVAMH
ncbi:MAG: fatty acid desaturase family protein [Candidatus Hydrogenedentota bacterium]